MTTSRKKPFLSDVLGSDRIPLGTLSYFRERFRDRLYDLVMEEFLKQQTESGLTRAEVARRISRRPEQVTRWFAAPGNWTLETVSDLLLAVAKSEPDVTLWPLEGRAVRNDRGQSILDRHVSEPVTSWLPGSAIKANHNTEELSANVSTTGSGQRRHQGPLAAILGGQHEAACN